MAGERKGVTYEALVKLALDGLVEKGQLKGRVFWNQKPEAMTIEPDFTAGLDKDQPTHVFLVTHSGSAGDSHKKFWRNMGELSEAKVRLTNPARVYSIVFDAVVKEDLKALQDSAFDGQLIVGDTDYGRGLQKWVDANTANFPKDGNEKAELIRQAMKAGVSTENPKRLVEELQRDIRKMLRSSRQKNLWALDRKRPVNASPGCRTTFVRRGISKLLIFEEPDLALKLYRRLKVAIGDLPGYAFSLGLASHSIAGASPSDPEILNAVSILSDAQIRRVLAAAPIERMSAWLVGLRRSEHLTLMGQYVLAHASELSEPQILASRLKALHADPAALIVQNQPTEDWPPRTVWLLDFLIELVRLSTGSANGFGYAQLGRQVVDAGFTKRDRGNPRIWVGGFILSDWMHRRGAEELDSEALDGIASVLSSHLRTIGEQRIGTLVNQMPVAYARHIVEAKLVTYKEFDPLFLLIKEAVPEATMRKYRSCFAEASGFGGQAGRTTVAVARNTLINWQSAHGSHTNDKRKELCGRAIGLRYSWDANARKYVPRAGIRKFVLVLDGTWRQDDLNALACAGWDEIFYPDEMDRLVRAIV